MAFPAQDATVRTTATSSAEGRLKAAIHGKVGKKGKKKAFLKNILKKSGNTY